MKSGVGRRPAYWKAPADFRQITSHNKKILLSTFFPIAVAQAPHRNAKRSTRLSKSRRSPADPSAWLGHDRIARLKRQAGFGFMLPLQGSPALSCLTSGPPSPHLRFYLLAEASGKSACWECSRTTSNVGDGGLLIRAGVGLTAAGFAAFAIGFISSIWVPLDTGPADVELRAEARRLSVSGSIHPKPADLDTATIGSDGQESSRESSRAQLAGLRTQDDFEFAFKELDNRSAPLPAHSPFGERFSFDEPSAPSRFSQPSDLSAFSDAGFGGEASAPSTGVGSAAAAPRAAGPRIAAAAPAPRPAARSAVAQLTPKPAAPKPAPATGFRLASLSDTSLPLGYAPSDPVRSSVITGSTPKDPTPKDSDPLGGIDASHTAIYDIAARTVYLPNGRRLEAHSGFGDHMDDIRYVNRRGTGPTPPNVYELKLREELFHGVRAIRLIPTDSAKMYGRDGILAHSYLLGPNGQSNGCVSLSDYPAFLDAFLRGDVNRLVVVQRLADPPPPQAVSDWFSDKLKDLFRRS